MAENTAVLSQEEKTCLKCRQVLPVAMFGIRSTGVPSTRCKPCEKVDRKEAQRRWAEKNPEGRAEARRQAMRRFRVAHPERVRKALKAWHQKNPAYERDRGRRRYANDPARQQAANRAWADRHPGWLTRWYRTPAGIALRAKRSACRRGALGVFTAEEWVQMLDRFGHRCAYCKSPGKMTMDHVVPISRGGKHEASNIVPACPRCNSSKGARTPDEWRARREGTL